MNTKQIIKALKDEFQAEIEHICSLPSGSTEILQLNWIPGTELTIGVRASLWSQVQFAIPERVSFSDMIHLHWFETRGSRPEETEIYIRMGRDVWQSTRCDRFRGSRILSMLNDSPADSTKRLQTIKLVRGAGSGILAYHGKDVKRQHEHFRLMAHFLRMSLGLCPRDIGSFIGRISQDTSNPFNVNRVKSKIRCPKEKLMFIAACEALGHAERKGYWTRLRNIESPQALSDLDDRYHISAANRTFSNSWAVMAILIGGNAMKALSQIQPSTFMWTPRHLRCKPQVHVIETPICNLHYPILLGFDQRPSKKTIGKSLRWLRTALSPDNLDSFDTAIITLPFLKDDTATWFRADGMLEKNFKDKVLAPHLRSAFAALRATPSDFKLELLQDTCLFVDQRQPARWIIWLRQSNEDGKKARDTMPRQLTTVLHGSVLGDGLRRGDQVVVCCELCSSNKHPLKDRRLWNTIRGMRDMPLNILTVNPDRMTRRSAEIDTVKDFVASTGGRWYTQGVTKEDGVIENWHAVDGDTVSLIKKQLVLGRRRALHGGFFTRRTQMMTIINDAVDRLVPVPTQINAAAAIIRHCVETHQYQRVVLVSRTSPAYQTGKESIIDTSIIRQSCFLNTMFGACFPPAPDSNQVIRLELAGYSEEEVIKRLQNLSRNARINGVLVENVKTLVAAISVDRLVGSTQQYENFIQVSRDRGYGAMSMLWDHRTEPDVCTALNLDRSRPRTHEVATWESTLRGQKRATRHSLNLPILQPILWAQGKEQTLSGALHAFRHVKSAEVYKEAMKTSMYQGGPLIAPELSERSADNHGLSEERMQAYKACVQEILPEGVSVNMLSVNGGLNSWTCSCSVQSHDPDCQCCCRKCDEARTCPCTVEKCDCLLLCNCRCRKCHGMPVSTSGSLAIPGDDLCCSSSGCLNKASSGSSRCHSCEVYWKARRECAIPGCARFAPHAGYEGNGKYCGECCKNPKIYDYDPGCRRKCQEKDCEMLAPVGCDSGTRCPGCKNKRSSAFASKKRKRGIDDVGDLALP